MVPKHKNSLFFTKSQYIMRKIFIIIFLALTLTNVNAQKVGLVLSGGGAKGLYHIGIIKALEENEIPIDYISGTSMGAIIAGLYAAGYSADDMIYLFTTDNVQGWVSGKIESKYVFYYSQDKSRPSLFSTNIDLRSIIQTQKAAKLNTEKGGMFAGTTASTLAPATILSSTQLDVELMGYFSPANALAKGDFNNLFVPFRCVAADVVTKKQYVWKNGNLAKAIRSSMAIPIIFSPIIRDSMVLYDGGVYNNFPWREMEKEFNPEFIIGARCVAGGSPNIRTLTGQLELMIMQTTDYNIPADKGLVIGRNVDMNILDFSNPMLPIELGYKDALKMIDSIKNGTSRRVSPEEVARRRLKYKSNLPMLEFSGRSVENLNDVQVKKRKGIRITGDTLYINTSKPNTKKLQSESYSFAQFKNIFYRTVMDREMKSGFPEAHYNNETGLFDLKVKLSSVPIFKLRGGLNISSSSINQAYLGFIYQDNRRNRGIYTIDGYLGSFYNSAEVSTRHNFYENKHPFYLKTTATYNYTDYARANNQKITFNSLFKEGNYISNEIYISSLIGVKMGKNGKVEFRAAVGNENVKYVDKYISEESIPDEKGRILYATLGGAMLHHKLNFEAFPTRGYRQSISVSTSYGDIKITSPVEKMKSEMETSYLNRNVWVGLSYHREQYFQLAKMFTLGFSINAVWTNLPNMGDEYVRRSFAPRYTPTAFSKTLFLPEFQKNSYSGIGAMPIFELNDKLYIKSGIFLYKPYLFEYKDMKNNVRLISDVTAVFQTPVGPLSFSYNNFNASATKKSYWIFSFGYMIFNKRGVVY